MTFRTIETDTKTFGATNDTPNAVRHTRMRRHRRALRSNIGGSRFVGLGI